MRIVGGACSKRALKVPRKGVRPTKAIVREAIFNVIGNRINNARVLDIFAGSGALGIESLSRGAKHCTFVEKDPKILRDNITALSFEKNVTVLAHDFRRALRLVRKYTFDVIFADPPYNKKLAQIAVNLVSKYDLLSDNGLIIIEHSPREKIAVPETLSTCRERKYGDTTISILEHRTYRKENPQKTHAQKTQK
jgi:16S rRNA (guanine966-N2)-methyltransferase